MNAAALLVFARCAGFASRAPGFSHPSVPHAVRAGLALLLAAAIAPSVHAPTCSGVIFVIACATELAVGAAIGLGASVLYDGAFAGGRMLDDYVGVKAIAPNLDLVAPSGFGRVCSIAFTGAFFLLGAYRFTLLGFAASFTRLPVGMPLDPHAWSTYAIALVETIVSVALAVAAPAIALAFVVQVALAALARTIPRFASFQLSFPIVFAMVLTATAVMIPVAVYRAAQPPLVLPGAR